ncbi:MAG: hypothetical protein ACOX8P_05390 [Tepidanaerobacteraceae bacterium]|jgi:hypothetical protein
MDQFIRNAILEVLKKHEGILRIAVRQKAKFEGWLKFELANYLEQNGMDNVEVESKFNNRRERADISFFYHGEAYSLELKTPNTNWRVNGVKSLTRPITKNIESIVKDEVKLRNSQGIVAFVLFPVPLNDNRWEQYLYRIGEKTKITLDRKVNCTIMKLKVNEKEECNLIICAFKSRKRDRIYSFT